MDWHAIGEIAVYILAGLICLGGLVLSCLYLSGTWAVLLASILVAWVRWPGFPSLGILALFLALCIGVEILEAIAGAWGVQKRGGSKAAGWAALVGGFLGMIIGGNIVPVLGNILGMLIGSFVLAFWAEYNRMQKTEHAAHVAFGAVMARLSVLFLKVGITLIMTLLLAMGIVFSD